MKKVLNKKNILIALYAFLIAFLTLMLASKNSFLYPFNDWVDANAFFTVGKSMFHGIVPYKDLFEQKGPLLYFIYGIPSDAPPHPVILNAYTLLFFSLNIPQLK